MQDVSEFGQMDSPSSQGRSEGAKGDCERHVGRTGLTSSRRRRQSRKALALESEPEISGDSDGEVIFFTLLTGCCTRLPSKVLSSLREMLRINQIGYAPIREPWHLDNHLDCNPAGYLHRIIHPYKKTATER